MGRKHKIKYLFSTIYNILFHKLPNIVYLQDFCYKRKELNVLEKSFFILLFWFFCIGTGFGQIDSPFFFVNSSFEGDAQDASVPPGWLIKKKGSTPDILPGPWGVYTPPYDGDTYLGLITREDNTWEDIFQILPIALDADECYKFSIYLAHSQNYVGYKLPVRLRVWACDEKGNKTQLLATSPLISHSDWKKYDFNFITKRQTKGILFEAYFAAGVKLKYRGNILLDALSAIERCKGA